MRRSGIDDSGVTVGAGLASASLKLSGLLFQNPDDGHWLRLERLCIEALPAPAVFIPNEEWEALIMEKGCFAKLAITSGFVVLLIGLGLAVPNDATAHTFREGKYIRHWLR